MENLTKNGMAAVLMILKSPESRYNANSLSEEIGISAMGCLKILRKLEKDSVLASEKIGNSFAWRIGSDKSYSVDYLKFVLKREAEKSAPQAKRWISELRKLKNADVAILFGSALKKKEPNDIDVLLVTSQKRFPKLKREVEEIGSISAKKLHPLYQTKEDLKKNILARDGVVLNAIKGIVALGEEEFTVICIESCRK